MYRLTQTGKIAPKASKDIQKSIIGLGFEKLDRDVFDPTKSYDFVARSGVKWARLQSGWQRTEKQKGVYDFQWLDDIVDSMLNIGVRKPNGSSALVYWIPKDILTETVETTVSLRIKKEAVPGEVRLADLLTGHIYSMPENMLTADSGGYWCFHNLPATDSPLMITFGDFYS